MAENRGHRVSLSFPSRPSRRSSVTEPDMVLTDTRPVPAPTLPLTVCEAGALVVRSEFETLRSAKAPASHTVSGNVGAGTGRVSVSTMSGSVTLLRRLGREGKESETR